MNRISTKMKLLSLGLLGLGGLALAGSASAACPGNPVPPWTSTTQYQGSVAIVSGGLGGTSCRLNATINAGAGPFASAQVMTDSPSNEPRYRVQFIVDLDGLSATPGFTDSVYLMVVLGNGTDVKLGAFGDGSGWRLSYFVPGAPSGSVALNSGENVIEFDLQVGASGSFKAWVNNNNEGSPDVSLTGIDTSALGGITDTYMGLTAPTGAYVLHYGGSAVELDQFDSRRSTFIGY